jgi:hypothetical protein
VSLSVSWGGDAGSDTFRDDFRRAVAESLATRCFASVAIAEGTDAAVGSDLVLALVLSGEVDEARFDDSIVTALEPGDPAKELRVVARCAVTVDATLSVRASNALVARKHFGVDISRRPLSLGEDAQAGARAGAVDASVRALRKALGCESAKLAREVRDALAAGSPGAPPSR